LLLGKLLQAQETTVYPPQQTVWLGKLKNQADELEIGVLVRANNGNSRALRHVRLHRFEFNNPDVAERLLRTGKFEFLEPDQTVTIDATPSDPLYSQLWGMTNIQANLAWDTSVGSDAIIVAVIDTGIWTEHPDLAANIWTDPISGSHGWTCIRGVLTEGVIDDQGHGTHVTGTIAAVGDNGIGVAGVNWRAKVAGFKFLGGTGSGQLSDAVMLMDKIIQLKKERGINFRITSNSWGSTGTSDALGEAFERLQENNILSIVAAGNNAMNIDVSTYYPAGATNKGVVTVMATDTNNAKASFSNWGYGNVDIAAPGVSVLSTVPTNAASLGNPSGYRSLSGTSMATPHVAGLAALALSVNPALTFSELRDLLLHPQSYDGLTDLAAQQSGTGGRINARKTLANSRIFNPEPNSPPVLTVSFTQNVHGGDTCTISGKATDPNGDSVRVVITSENNLFPQTLNSVTFVAHQYAIDFVARVSVVALDGKGGSTQRRIGINILKRELPPMEFGLDTRIWQGSSISNVQVMACLTPESTVQPVRVSYMFGELGKLSTTTWMVYRPYIDCDSTEYGAGLTVPKAVVCYAFGENLRKDIVLSYYKYFRVGGTTNLTEAPTINPKFINPSGTAPLTVSYDFTGCVEPYGLVRTTVDQDGTGGKAVPLVGTLTYANPGTYRSKLFVSGKYFTVGTWFYVTVLSQDKSDEFTPDPPMHLRVAGAKAKQ